MADAIHDLLITALDSSPTGVCIARLDDGTILYINDGMAAFFDITRDAAVGRQTTFFFVDSADRIKVRDALAKQGEIRKLTVRNQTARGLARSSIFSCRLIDFQGQKAILTWLEDETERVQREQEILSASKQVELLHQIAGICNRAVNFYDALRKGAAEIARCLNWPVAVVYRQAHDDAGLLQLASMALPKDDARFEPLRSILVGRAFRAGEDVPGRALATREIVWIEDAAREKDLSRFAADDALPIASCLGVPVLVDDAVVAVVELLTDTRAPRDERMALTLMQVSAELAGVHLRDKMTVALQEARAEAESSARAKANFLATMSHEVRTPMNGVVGMVDLVLGTKLDDEQRFMLQTVKDSGHALIKVINDILDFSKIEAGRLEIEEAAFSITKTVENVGLSLAPVARKKGLTLITSVDPQIPEMVLGDAVRVRQILSNLAANAVKFSTRGEVVIKAELMPDQDITRAYVRFSVRDEGIGIAADAVERLFEEFQQADTSTTRRFGGTGLGLAICQRLTSLMDGKIGVDSVLGIGSEFHCTLPFALEAQPENAQTADLNGLTVLVVSESTELRDVCRNYLTFWKADVIAVERLRDCIMQIRNLRKAGKTVDVVVIPQPEDARQVSALRQGLADVAVAPHLPRLVVGRDPHAREKPHTEVTPLDTNPMRRAALVTAVAIAAGRASPETVVMEPQDIGTDIKPPTVDEALAQGRLVLVAEDHIANQEVLRRQLNRLGYACEIAEDGVIALKMWRAKNYALLLTDCHMPNMDGFGLTAEIRKTETGAGKRAPIIAITANVLQGEAERCLAAGMDAFLPKPVELATLRATLSKWIDGVTTAPEPAKTAAQGDLPVLDLTTKREAFGEIDDGVREYFGIFIESVQPLIAQFEDELAGERLLEARETIHKAKGATANAGGRELAALMHDIELALVNKNYHEARSRTQDIRPAWDRLAQAIAET